MTHKYNGVTYEIEDKIKRIASSKTLKEGQIYTIKEFQDANNVLLEEFPNHHNQFHLAYFEKVIKKSLKNIFHET